MILIPAYEPTERLLSLIDDLRRELRDDLAQTAIVVVDDGSRTAHARAVFASLADRNVVVLVHPENRGKGAAIKTGLAYAQANRFDWVVTADADGQHLPRDIVKVARHGLRGGHKMVLGTRHFNRKVPLRSLVGNVLTRWLFLLVYHVRVADTQSGLRLIPARLYHDLLAIEFNRYEFEFEALVLATRRGGVEQVDIETVYEAGNVTSHFNPIWDSLRIYYVLLRSVASSVLISLVDISSFAIISFFVESTALAIAFSRTLATLLQFFLARHFVFRSGGQTVRQFVYFTALVLANIMILAPIIDAARDYFVIPKFVSYAVGATALYAVNFSIMRWMIFNDRSD